MPRRRLINLRRGASDLWTSVNPVLAEGEPGFETDTGRFKFGDGATPWNDLAYNAPLPTYVSAAEFGATGDGTTDDTVALQSWLDYIVTNHLAGWLPKGNYKLTAALTVTTSPSYGWSINGEGQSDQGSAFVQATSNVPIISIGDGTSLHHSIKLRGVRFTYSVAQSSSNTSANHIHLNCAQQLGMFESRFEDLAFTNGYYAFNSPSGGWWATVFDGISIATMSGGAMNWTGVTGGMPNNRYGRWSITVSGMTGPVFNNWRGYNQHVGTLEFLQANQGQKLISTASGFTADIGSLKLEIGTYAAAQNIFEFLANHRVRIGQVSISGTTAAFNPASGVLALFALGGGGVTEASSFEVGSVQTAATSLSGNVVVISGGTTLLRPRIGSVHLANGWTLQYTGGTTTADFLTVGAWANGAVSADKGDANYTVTLGDPTVICFNTPFTATRTITIPDTLGNNVHGGLAYKLVFDGAINGANQAIIKPLNRANLRTQTTDKVAITYTYRRNAWVLTGYETLP